MRLAILIPVYNEQDLLQRAIDRLDATAPPTTSDADPLERQIILVNDGSTDSSGDIIDRLAQRDDITAIHHAINQGKGRAIRTALDAASEIEADIVLIHDADLEYDPADHATILAPILAGDADAVIGSRFIGQSHRVLYYWHALGNRLITTTSNILTNLNLTDIECCSKAFTREVFARLEINENRFGLEPEIIARLSKMRITDGDTTRSLRIFEVGVRYSGRTYAEGKKITWRDAVSAMRCILRYNLFG